MMEIPIQEYNRIIKAVGYPVIKEDDLEYTKDEIIELIIQPIVETYYIWFPKRLIESKIVGVGDFCFKFPREDVFGVEDIRFNPDLAGHGKTNSPFVNAINYQIANYNQYGTRYDYGAEAASYMEDSYDRTKMNNLRAVRFDIDSNAREVRGYSNDTGEIVITWKVMSYNFMDIPIERRKEVIDLCQAELMRSVAMIRGQIDDGSGTTLNTDDFTSRADALEEKVMNHWKAISKVAILRN